MIGLREGAIVNFPHHPRVRVIGPGALMAFVLVKRFASNVMAADDAIRI
jgi:hypothetical protein